MLSIFGKHYALTESGFRYGDAYDFTGTFHEAVAEFGHFAMNESLEMNSYVAEADEIIAEAYLNGSYKVDILVENVFNDVIEQAKKIWKKLIEWVKGLIAKLETYILQFTGQTNKWAEKMSSRIKNASVSDFKYEYHRWSIETIDKLCDKAIIDRYENSDSSNLSIAPASDQLMKLKNDITSIKSTDNWTDKYNQLKQDSVKEELKKAMISAYSSYLNVPNKGVSEKEFKSAIDKKVTGGEKVTQSVDSGSANRMLEFVKGAKDRMTDTKEIYKDLKKDLDTDLDSFDDIKRCIEDIDDSHVNSDVSEDDVKNDKVSDDKKKNTQAFKSYFTSVINCITSVCTTEKRFVSDLGNMANKYIRSCAFEYMTVLTAYCNASDKQNKKKK